MNREWRASARREIRIQHVLTMTSGLTPHDAFYMSGWGKQICAVIPSLDLVVVRLGPNRVLNDHPEFYPEFFSRVLAALLPSRKEPE